MAYNLTARRLFPAFVPALAALLLLAPLSADSLGPQDARQTKPEAPETKYLSSRLGYDFSAADAAIEKAIADHRRWVEWTRWAAVTAGGRQAASELAALETIRGTVATAWDAWAGAAPGPAADPGAGWYGIFPGVYLEPPKLAPAARMVALVSPEGRIRTRPLGPPPALADEDRFLFWVLNRRMTEGRDPTLKDVLARWVESHGEALGVRPAPSAAAERRS